MAAFAFGGSAVITASLGAVLAAFAGIATPFLVLLLVGIFLLGLAGIGTLGQRLRVGQPQLASETSPAVAAPSVFDPYTISSDLAQVDLSGLSEPESFMMITLNVRNVSGYPVTITGVKGRIRCAGAECNMNATVEREPRQLSTSSYDRVPCTIRQPLSSGMMNTVALAGNLLRISLSGLQWVGSVALPQGSVPLERCYIHEDFVVKWPFREKRDAGALFRLTTTFLSSEHYDSDGTPKQNG